MLKIIFLLIFTWKTVTSDNCHSVTLKDRTTCSNSSTVKILLENAQKLIEDAKKYSSAEESCYPNECFCKKPVDCAEILDKNRQSISGIYKIWPRSRIMDNALKVYCDMNDDGGAWTVIQRRGNFDSAKDYFFQDWASYKKGFGDLEKDFWLGNDNIYALTNQRMYSLKFDLVDWNNTKVYASFDEFYIDDEAHNYTSHVKSYRGNAGDSFSFTNGIPFSTKDKDNDKRADNSCAAIYKGAWWYTSCHSSNLNGLYLKGSHESFADGVNWYAFRGHNHSLKDTVIKIRPKHFIKTGLDSTPQ